MNASRAVDMAALENHAELLCKYDHRVRIFILGGEKMKEQRYKAAQHIFTQCKKEKRIAEDSQFDKNDIDVSDISDDGRFYGGLIFVPNVASRYCQFGRTTAAADAAHCDGVGPQSYGTTFEVVTYDTNMHLLPLVFAHFIGPENKENWKIVFEECKRIPGFDIPGRTTIVDQEKSIDMAYKEVFENAEMFLDPLHVRMNMGAKLGAARAIGLSLYERALYAPSPSAVDEIVQQYSEPQRNYLSRFPPSELYKAYSSLRDTVVTSQAAESQMSASLRNHIRSVEPQKMLHKVVTIQRAGFQNRQAAAEEWKHPVPPNIEKQLARLITRSRVYQDTVKFCKRAHGMEATVTSLRDGSVQLRVILPSEEQKPPICCGYSDNGDGLPCFHGTAVVCEKFGASNLHRFVDSCHLTTNWKALYDSISFPFPKQMEVDEIVSNAKMAVATGQNLNVPKALPPTRGRLVKNAGVRRKGWFERGPTAKKKRTYQCSLCHQTGHTSAQYQLRQLFGDD